MKGLFIPEITAEMFRNGCLEGIEALMAKGEIYDIDYTGWIPVSERLPEKYKQVMCCDNQGRVFTSAMTHINSNDKPSFGKHYGVIAWKPLPKPYKESDNE